MRVPARKFSSYKSVGRAALQAMKEKDSDAVVEKDTKEQQVYAEEVEHTAWWRDGKGSGILEVGHIIIDYALNEPSR